MVQVLTLVDDLDGVTEADKTVPFSLLGKDYLIDLSTDHVAELVECLAPFVRVARPANKPPRIQRAGRAVALPEPLPAPERVPASASAVQEAAARGDWWVFHAEDSRPMNLARQVMRKEMRAWGRLNGWPELGVQGVTPHNLINAYLDAHPELDTRHRLDTEDTDPDADTEDETTEDPPPRAGRQRALMAVNG